jgi:tRNA-dependent cyclodipeptide synthase
MLLGERGACAYLTDSNEDVLVCKTRYKAKVDSVSPTANRASFAHAGSCFLGVSLENNNFRPDKLSGIVEWLSRRFSMCTVLIGDSIHRLTLQSTQALDPVVALSRAVDIGHRFVEDSLPIFDRYGSDTRFEFLTCQAVQAGEYYQQYHRQLTRLYTRNADFRASIHRFGERYHSKNSGLTSVFELNNRVNVSAQYFLEEFAIFACLRRQGQSVMVYPGSFSTLSEIACGLHPQAPDELQSLTVVSLCLKGR